MKSSGESIAGADGQAPLLKSFDSQSNDEVLRARGAGVSEAVFLVRGHISHRAGAEARGPIGNSNLQSALANQESFFMRVVVRRMRHGAGRKLGLMYLYSEATVGLSFQDAAKRSSPTRLDGQVFKSDGH
jgi:hypothetical protein